ncbi:SprB repeat-containing protein [Marivirga sp.]|uniref:SprB repeat-containing protein n=1 Tax=Marivirga sp. TaxID=2018662 RepID=UPI003DA6D0F7
MAINLYELFSFEDRLNYATAKGVDETLYVGVENKIYERPQFATEFSLLYTAPSGSVAFPIIFNGKLVCFETRLDSSYGTVRDQLSRTSGRIIGKIPDFRKLWGIINFNNRLYIIGSQRIDSLGNFKDIGGIWSIDDTPVYSNDPPSELFGNNDALRGWTLYNGALYVAAEIGGALGGPETLYKNDGTGWTTDRTALNDTPKRLFGYHFVGSELRAVQFDTGDFVLYSLDNDLEKTQIFSFPLGTESSFSNYAVQTEEDSEYIYILLTQARFDFDYENYLIRYKKSDNSSDLLTIPSAENILLLKFNDFDEGFGNALGQYQSFNEPSPINIEVDIEGFNIDLTVTGGVPGYVYQWSDGAQTEDRTNLSPGIYTVVVTDSQGNQAQVTINLESAEFQFSKNPVILELSAENPETKPNLSFVCEVEVEQDYLSDNLTKIITLEQPADENGETIFDVSAALDAYFDNELPSLSNASISLKKDSILRYRLRYTEKFGNPPAEGQFTQANIFYVIKGGLSDIEYAKGNFFNQLIDGSRGIWFNWNKNQKTIFQNQYDFLSFILVSALDAIKFEVKINYTDGTFYETSLLNQIEAPIVFEVYQFPSSIIQLGLDDYFPSKTIKSYQISILDQNDKLILDKFQYNVEQNKVKRQFLYLNTLGVWAVEGFNSNSELKLSTEEEVIQKNLGVKFKPTDTKEEVVRKTGNMDDKVFAGFKTKEEIEHLFPFILSESVYEIVKNEFVPVRLNFSNNVEDDFEKIIPVEFEVIKPPIKNYTPSL